MKPYRIARRWACAAPSEQELHQQVEVRWVLDGVTQVERGLVVGLADSPPDLGPGWWYLVEILEGMQPGTRDWFPPEQLIIEQQPMRSPVQR